MPMAAMFTRNKYVGWYVSLIMDGAVEPPFFSCSSFARHDTIGGSLKADVEVAGRDGPRGMVNGRLCC